MAVIAATLADPTRAVVCESLLDGRAWTAGELARAAGVAPSTMTEHLHRLVRAGLLTEQRLGRHRYLRLSSPEAGRLIETLSGWGHRLVEPAGTVRPLTAVRLARTCYDHLAGRLGVAVCAALVREGVVDLADAERLTDAGHAWVGRTGVVLPEGRRPTVRTCVDGTERLPHLAGALGTGLLDHARSAGWVRQGPGRALIITRPGAAALDRLLGIDVDALRRAPGGVVGQPSSTPR